MRSRICALALVALFPATAAASPPAPTPILDLDVSCDGTLVVGSEARLEVGAHLATTLLSREPVAGAEVTVVLADKDGEHPRQLWRGLTDASGRVAPRFVVPSDAPGSVRQLRVTLAAAGRTARFERAITLSDDSRVQLRVDRTLYRPGSVIRWRVALLRTVNAHPVAGDRVAVDIVDPRGTSVWSGTVTTDARGLAAGELPLADDLTTGDYELRARAGDATDRLTITVRPFEMPPFLLDLDFDADAVTAGRRLEGTVRAHTAYGEGVVGHVVVELNAPGAAARVLLDTEAQGEPLTFTANLADLAEGGAVLSARATDTADRSVTTTRTLTIGRPRLDVTLVVPGDTLLAGPPQPLHVLTSDAAGAAVPARLTVTLEESDGTVLFTHRDASPGAATVAVAPPRRVARSRDEVTGRLERWSLEHSERFFARQAPDELVQRALEGSARPAARCIEHEAVDVDLTFDRKGWRLDSARVRPFPDRPDFVMDASPRAAACLESLLKRRLPTPRRPSARTRAHLDARFARFTHREEWQARPRRLIVRVAAVAPDGREASAVTTVDVVDERDARRIVTPERAIVPVGEPVRVRAPWPTTTAPVYATLLRHGAPVASALCRRDGDDVVAELAAPAGTYGLAAVRVHSVSWSPEAPKPLYASGVANVFLAPNTLDVAVASTKRQRPGAQTALDVTVHDALGRVAAGVGLVAAVVDERLQALARPQVDLPTMLMSEDLSAIAARGELFGRLLRRPGRTAVEEGVMSAIVASVPLDVRAPEVALPAHQRYIAERNRCGEAALAALPVLVKTPGAVVTRGDDAAPVMASPLAAVLTEAGWKPAGIAGPFGLPRTWADVTLVQPRWTASAFASHVTADRMDAIVARLAKRRSRVKQLARRGPFDPSRLTRAAHLATDAWGGRFEVGVDPEDTWIYLRSAGPDGAPGTSDDVVRFDIYGEGFSGGMGYYGVGVGGGGVGGVGSAMMSRGLIRQGRGYATAKVAPLRERFDETALWIVGETTDDAGRAHLPFTLPDSVTGWDVHVEAIAADGAVGVGRAHLETYLPLHVEVRAPRHLTVGDRHEVAAYVTNHEAAGTLTVALQAEGGLRVDGAPAAVLDVPQGETRAARFTVIAAQAGDARLVATLSDAHGERDAIARQVEIAGQGLARRMIVPGELRDGAQRIEMTVPEDADRDTVRGRLRVYRGAADQAIDGLEGLLREPHGCFEQTTSTTYPNLLVLHLLEGSRSAPAGIVARAREMVGKGYQRLLRYEVDGGGFSWFGNKPANLTLTALGVMEFSDMAAVYPVDPKVIQRTRRWVEGRQNRNGSFPAESRWAPDEGGLATTAFVTWALAETGGVDDAVRRGLRFLRSQRRALAKRPYALALWAAAEARAGGDAATPLAILDGQRITDVEGTTYPAGQGTLFMESGRIGQVDTTALVATARTLARSGRRPDAELRWLWAARDARYGWGTTQATVQALRAATVAHDRSAGAIGGTVTVRLDGREIGRLDLDADEVPSLTLPAGVAPGAHALTLEGPKELQMWTDLRLGWRGSAPSTPTSDGLVVHLEAATSKVAVGEQVELTVAVANPGEESVRMPTLTIPIPPGFAADRASLAQLVRESPVTRFDETGDRVDLYLTELGPGDGLVMRYRLEATTPCDVQQAPAEAYAYYTPDVRGTSAPLRLTARRRGPTTASAAP